MRLFRRIRYWLHHRRHAAELAEEMEFHRAMTGDVRAMGNTTRMREESRAVWIWPWIESVWQDVAYALRSLRRQPAFTLVAVGALAAAIGLNTSLFTVFNTIALRPWPVKDPGRVVNVLDTENGFSMPEIRYLSEHARTFAGMIAMRKGDSVNLGERKILCSWVSGNYFSVLGVGMQRGRGFLPEEDVLDSPQTVVVLSHVLWENSFASDPEIVGKQIRLGDVPFTVVGVTSSEFTGTMPDRIGAWIPLPAAQLFKGKLPVRNLLRRPQDCCSLLAGRLAPGVTRQQAQAELSVLSKQFRSEFHLDPARLEVTGTAFIVNAKTDRIVPVFLLLFAGVMLVLLLACANVGNLLLARAAARRREIAVRLSLGASRARVVRQLLTESFVLACGAGALGIAVAWRLPAYLFYRGVGDNVAFSFVPDATVLGYTLALCAFTCFVFGLAPALHGTRPTMTSRFTLRSLLLLVQVAVSVVLLVGAGLLVRGVERMQTQDPGFVLRGVDIVQFELPAEGYTSARTRTFFTQLVRDLHSHGIGLTMLAPLGSGRNSTGFRLPGEYEDQQRTALVHEVTGGYFEVLRIPIVAGRNFTAADTDRNAILVNETMALYLGGNAAIGKSVIVDTPREIVGIVKDAYTTDLNQIEPTIYRPISGQGTPLALISAATPGVIEKMKAAAKQFDPRVRVNVTPLSDNLDRWLQGSRVGAAIAGALGVLALALATIGMFGVFAYWVQQRTREIGIRMALGARPRQVIRLVLGASSRAVVIGLIIGFAGAAGASRLLARFLFGVSPLDPIAYGGVALLLAVASLAATWWPARRATKIDPIRALHYE